MDNDVFKPIIDAIDALEARVKVLAEYHQFPPVDFMDSCVWDSLMRHGPLSINWGTDRQLDLHLSYLEHRHVVRLRQELLKVLIPSGLAPAPTRRRGELETTYLLDFNLLDRELYDEYEMDKWTLSASPDWEWAQFFYAIKQRHEQVSVECKK